MRISDWSSDVCSSDLVVAVERVVARAAQQRVVASLAIQEIIAGSAIELVVSRAPRDSVVKRVSRAVDVAAVELEEFEIGAEGIADGAVEIGRASGWERVCQYG